MNNNVVNRSYGNKIEQTFIWSVKRVLEKYNIKQTEFAKGIGVSKQTLYHYLTGRRSMDLETVCTIINSFKVLIPKFNFAYLFDNTQDILLHDKTNYIYDEKETLIQKLDSGSLDVLYKMLKNEMLPFFLKSIHTFFSDRNAERSEHIDVFEEIEQIKKFLLDDKSYYVILRYLLLMLYNMAPGYHKINNKYDLLKDSITKDEKKSLYDICDYLLLLRNNQKVKKVLDKKNNEN